MYIGYFFLVSQSDVVYSVYVQLVSGLNSDVSITPQDIYRERVE